MKPPGTGSFALEVSFPLAALVAVASGAGVFWSPTYARETPLWATEGMGGDAVNLLVIVPVLLISALWARRGSLPARLIWMGTLVFLLYNFFIYAVAVHFNALFLVYCAILGVSFYALVGSFPSLSPPDIAATYGTHAPARTLAGVFFLLAFFFGAQWLREIIPALLSGQAPRSVTEAGLLTSPVHVLDLALVLPGTVLIGIMLLRGKALAFVLAPILLVFSILMTLAIVGMMVALTYKGFSKDYVPAGVFVAFAAGCVVLLARYLRPPQNPPGPAKFTA